MKEKEEKKYAQHDFTVEISHKRKLSQQKPPLKEELLELATSIILKEIRRRKMSFHITSSVSESR